ncbi:MAG: hypothetical protein LBJ59_10550 [Zoogloeaceae bacterium]|jgi:hypothetical protein|nr:hypothetical protein [Zoogloeaceae bacterium]
MNLKRNLASVAALFWFCSGVFAAPTTENLPSPPSGDVGARLYSLDGFNRLGVVAGACRVEAYFVALVYPQCKPGGRCFPVLALISDAPRDRVRANENIRALMDVFHTGLRDDQLQRAEAALNEAHSGYAFRVLDISSLVGTRLGNVFGNENPWDVRARMRIRARTENRTENDSRQLLVLEDFCAGADCENQNDAHVFVSVVAA